MIIELISLALVIVHKIIVPIIFCPSFLWALWYGLYLFSNKEARDKIKPNPIVCSLFGIKPKLHDSPKPEPKAQRRSIPPGAEALLFPNFHRVSPQTQRKLFAMCNGDHALVMRLARFNDQSAWEKAIYDLERDRR